MYGSIELRSSPEVEAQLRDFITSNTDLTDLLPADPLAQLVLGVSNEFEVCYVEIGKLLMLFDVRKCFNSDLDLRLVDYDTERLGKQYATGTVKFTRTSADPLALLIAAGTQVGTQSGLVYVTASDTTIPSMATESGEVAIVSKLAGSAYNVGTGAVSLVLTAFSGSPANGLVCTNPAPIQNGLDQEADDAAKTRVFAGLRALNRTAPDALEGAARGVSLPNNTSVKSAKLYENPFVPCIDLFVDNGTGKTETTATIGNGVATDGAGEQLVQSASAGQFRFRVVNWPVKIDYPGTGLPILRLFKKLSGGSSWAELFAPTDFHLKPGTGEIVLAVTLAAGDALQVHYTHYTGLVAEVQWTLDGRSSDPTRYPGGVAAGGDLRVRAPTLLKPTITASVVLKPGYTDALVAAAVRKNVVDALLVYINSREIGETVLLSMLYEVAMQVDGCGDFLVTSPAPADPANNIVPTYDAIIRCTAADITVS